MSNPDDVSVRLRHETDEDGEYGAFTSVDVDILVRGSKVGRITGTIVNRQALPERHFMSAMDGHSGDLQWVGSCLFEPRLGRTKLRSLAEYDDNEFDFLYVNALHVDDAWKRGGSSDVGAAALRQLLHHPFIKGDAYGSSGCWKVSSAVYVLDPYEAMTKEEAEAEKKRTREAPRAGMMSQPPPETEESLRAKEEEERRMDALARSDANQFLRNGFFQDAAVAGMGGNAARFVVASYGQWNRPQLLSHAEAAAVRFYVPPPSSRPPTGKDAVILQLTKRTCMENSNAAAMAEMGHAPPPREEFAAYQVEVRRLMAEGGSLSRSNALHAACANNVPSLVACILELDPSALEARDESGSTPLMLAAMSAAGRSNINGIPRDQPVIDRLLVAGAQRGAMDPKGMTAYGVLKRQVAEFDIMMSAMCGRATGGQTGVKPGLRELEAKLMPSGGATAADLSGGQGAEAGFVDYREEDAEADREMGRDEGGYSDDMGGDY